MEEAYRSRLRSILHYISHAAVAVQRNQPWRAIYEIEQIRNQTIELHGLREALETQRETIELHGLREALETQRFRHANQMSEDFLTCLEKTLVLSLKKVDMMNALKAATACFFREVRHFDKMLNRELVEDFETKAKVYLEFFEMDP